MRVRWTSDRDHRLIKTDASFYQRLDLPNVPGSAYLGPFRTGLQQEHLIEADPFVPKEVRGMGRHNHLTPFAFAQSGEQSWKVANHPGMERQLGLLEEK